MKKTLTLQYVLQQIAFWAAAAGIVSFATAFLLEKGFSASFIGILLASGNLLSCMFQPILAARADRMGGNSLKWLIIGMTIFSICCFLSTVLFDLPQKMMGLLYLLGIFSFDTMNPLNNAICVMYMDNGYRINYGMGRGIGSFSFSLSALLIGKVMAKYGADWMIWISVAILMFNILFTLRFPNIQVEAQAKKAAAECCSIAVFFQRYRLYCLSLLGIMMLAMFHAMSENYLIEIVAPLGGDSGSVGVALFIATAIGMPVMVFFDKIRERISDNWLLKLSGVFFLLKAVLFFMAKSVTAIYVIQTMQTITYCLLAPTQMYYANSKIDAADMVKGQAFITASYTLGCALGNFIGGQLIEPFSVTALLIAGIGMTVIGTGILFAMVDRKDEYTKRAADSKGARPFSEV